MMVQRYGASKNQWYHETQSSLSQAKIQPLVPEAARVSDRFLLDLSLETETCGAEEPWLVYARELTRTLFPARVTTTPLQTFSLYERLSTALTVAQVCGVQRLCHHYAALLTPHSSPDSSRETNRRLTLLTQFARQLTGEPTRLTTHDLNGLAECGLSSEDIITYIQLIGFVGFQSRIIALWQAKQHFPVRLYPCFSPFQDADLTLFSRPFIEKTVGHIPHVNLSTASQEQREAISHCQPSSPFFDDVRCLAHNPLILRQADNLIIALELSEPEIQEQSALVQMRTARINGSRPDFQAARLKWSGDSTLPDALCREDTQWQHFLQAHPHAHCLIQATDILTRSPDRFSGNEFKHAASLGIDDAYFFRILLSVALSNWLNRVGLGLHPTSG